VVREANVYCEIIPFNKPITYDPALKGIILSGSPFSVNEENAPTVDVKAMADKLPVLGVCYGAQLTAKLFSGLVAKSNKREYGRANFSISKNDVLLEGVSENSQVWMSHSDTIKQLPDGFELLGTTESIPVAAFKAPNATAHPIYGLQFHPEVYHSAEGKTILKNFLINICGCSQDWTSAHYITETVAALKEQLGNSKVVMGLSGGVDSTVAGGVDSTVAATLIHKAIGKNLYGIFVDNGVLRKNEFQEVLEIYNQLGLNVKGVNAREHFYTKLAGKVLPEDKRKAIGSSFIDIFDQEAQKLEGIEWLGQGTIYPG